MTKSNNVFLREGTKIRILDNGASLSDELAPNTYRIDIDRSGFYLQECRALTVPKKTYGDIKTLTDRICKTSLDRERSTGVHFTGKKGNGKSLQLRDVARQMLEEHQFPTIICENNELRGQSFNFFIESLGRRCTIVFDEFEKVYSLAEQEELLSLFDGTGGQPHLFLCTSNVSWGVSEFMRQRPGRIYYTIDYSELSEEICAEIIDDILVNREHREDLVRLCNHYRDISFDMLIAILEEMNRYNQSVEEVLKYIPIPNPDQDSDSEAVVKVYLGNQIIAVGSDDDVRGKNYLIFNPMTDTFGVYVGTQFHLNDDQFDSEEEAKSFKAYSDLQDELEDNVLFSGQVNFYPSDVVGMDKKAGTVLYEKNISSEHGSLTVKCSLQQPIKRKSSYFNLTY